MTDIDIDKVINYYELGISVDEYIYINMKNMLKDDINKLLQIIDYNNRKLHTEVYSIVQSESKASDFHYNDKQYSKIITINITTRNFKYLKHLFVKYCDNITITNNNRNTDNNIIIYISFVKWSLFINISFEIMNKIFGQISIEEIDVEQSLSINYYIYVAYIMKKLHKYIGNIVQTLEFEDNVISIFDETFFMYVSKYFDKNIMNYFNYSNLTIITYNMFKLIHNNYKFHNKSLNIIYSNVTSIEFNCDIDIIDSNFYNNIFIYFPNLYHIHYNELSIFIDNKYELVLSKIISLYYEDCLTEFTDMQIIKILKCYPNIQYVKIDYCISDISDKELTDIIFDYIKNAPLIELTLKFFDNIDKIYIDELLNILREHKTLKYLNLSMDISLTEYIDFTINNSHIQLSLVLDIKYGKLKNNKLIDACTQKYGYTILNNLKYIFEITIDDSISKKIYKENIKNKKSNNYMLNNEYCNNSCFCSYIIIKNYSKMKLTLVDMAK